MTGRSFRRHVEIIDLELADLKRAATAWGGTVNDVFVASVVRGLTLYHEQHGVVAPGFRALMPVNVRSGAAGEAGTTSFPHASSSPPTRTSPTAWPRSAGTPRSGSTRPGSP